MQLINSSIVYLEDNPKVGTAWIKDQFAPTPKMSTYLLAFLVSDFKFRETVAVNGLKVYESFLQQVPLLRYARA
jgi:aminopeptidase N